MKKLLSLPPNLVEHFHKITGYDKDEYFCTNDPIGHRLGSGGGTSWLLHEAHKADNSNESFSSWLGKEKRILMHAGGQGRRLPAYAPSGKILTPIPIFRWMRGQRLSQNLLSLQLSLYEEMMEAAPDNMHTMIVNGDVYIRTTKPLPKLPDADVICMGLWLGREIAKDHGVFVSKRETPQILDHMLQKPSYEQLDSLLCDHYFMTDIGIWFLSDKAVRALDKHCEGMKEYDLYSEFGCSLGENPTVKDIELNELKVVIMPLDGGEFYHYGSTPEIISSTLEIQNLVHDQREIIHRKVRVQPSIFTQNCISRITLTKDNPNIWIENSFIGKRWHISQKNVITGVPENDWEITLQPEDCIDIIPIGKDEYCARVYGFYDKFAGEAQKEERFPVTKSIDELGKLVNIQLDYRKNNEKNIDFKKLFGNAHLLSAEDISNIANLERLEEQRKMFRKSNWAALAANYKQSIFYQIDLNDAAQEFAANDIPLPPQVTDDLPLMTRIRDNMFRAETERLKNGAEDNKTNEFTNNAFALLREGLTSTVLADRQCPKMSVYPDQIVWGRSPVRIDLAGGWTDTPPYCLNEGGNVVNIAIELNGQMPLQTYVRPCKEYHIILRSIDLGVSETITTYEELADFNHVGSPFSIPKAALALAGFQPGFSTEQYPTLESQLKAFGCGIEVTSLAAIPAGSGLGTSSILASTVLGAVSNFCGLGWDKNEIGKRTLVLEQLLTTGGGWQDQFGGILQGVKLLQTVPDFNQSPVVRWLPDDLFTQAEYKGCHLLYYTGITRTAKKLLAEIVKKMFLNDSNELTLLANMKQHALDTYEAIQQQSFEKYGQLVRKTWEQNQLIDGGTNPESVAAITQLIDDYCLGYKLAGAGGGGYLYMVAKDPDAAIKIKKVLAEHRTNANERFVKMSISQHGLQISRS